MCEKIKDSAMSWQALIFWLVSIGYFAIWILHVQPFPDRDSVHQIYFPYLNAINISGSISANPLFLKSAFLDAYPWGLAFLPALIGCTGLWQIAVNYPWHLPALFLLPLAMATASQKLPFKTKIMFFLALFFCPMVQVALKSYSYHGLITLLVLPGAIIIWRGIQDNNRKFFWYGFLMIWYSATLKHLGAIHLMNLMLSYFIWKIVNNQLKIKDIVTGLLSLIALIPFYPLDGLTDYLEIAFSHNPKLLPMATIIVAIVVGLLTWSFLLWSFKRSSQHLQVNCFANGRGLLTLLCCSILIVSFGADQYSFELMTLSFLFGYICIYLILTRIDIKNPDGLLTLTIAITFTHGCILYFSFLGQVFANFFVPVGLVFVQGFYQSNRKARGLIVLLGISLSNFSPGLHQCEQWFWEWGHLYNSRGLNGLHQNPLGWEPSTLKLLRTKLTQKLLELDFPADQSQTPILFRGIHFHTRIQFLYPKNYWLALPELHLPGHLRHDKLEKLAKVLESSESTNELIKSGAYPIIIYGRKPWTLYPIFQYTCENFHEAVRERQENWEEQLSDCLIEKVFNDPNLRMLYRIFPLQEGNQLIKVYIHEKFLNDRKVLNFPGMKEFQEQWKLFNPLSWREKIEFKEVSTSERVYKLFKQANQLMNDNEWLESWKLLNEILKIDPEHVEAIKDLAIVEINLGIRTPQLDPITEIFRQAIQLIEKEDWAGAKELLNKGLELDPQHPEILKDLAIVEEKLGIRTPDKTP